MPWTPQSDENSVMVRKPEQASFLGGCGVEVVFFSPVCFFFSKTKKKKKKGFR